MSDILEIKTDSGGKYWMTKSELDLYRDMERKQFRIMMNGWYDHDKRKVRREARGQTGLCFAYVMVGNTQKMVMMNSKEMIAYKLDGYAATWMTWSKFTLVRWCTSFDI